MRGCLEDGEPRDGDTGMFSPFEFPLSLNTLPPTAGLMFEEVVPSLVVNNRRGDCNGFL